MNRPEVTHNYQLTDISVIGSISSEGEVSVVIKLVSENMDGTPGKLTNNLNFDGATASGLARKIHSEVSKCQAIKG